MKTVRARKGPLKTRPFFSSDEIENICVSELKKAGCLPTDPSPIRIERFIEKRFGICPEYIEMDPGILGFTAFGPKGVQAIYISSAMDEEGTVSSSRRARSTLAHEAGHGLLHGHLFVDGKPSELIPTETKGKTQILCRDIVDISKQYNGEWWEFQANKAMASLLLPKHLVEKELSKLFGTGLLVPMPTTLNDALRAQAVTLLSETFDVNPVVAKLRLQERWPLTN